MCLPARIVLKPQICICHSFRHLVEQLTKYKLHLTAPYILLFVTDAAVFIHLCLLFSPWARQNVMTSHEHDLLHTSSPVEAVFFNVCLLDVACDAVTDMLCRKKYRPFLHFFIGLHSIRK